ncbi:hypothetical protein BVRB_6g147850 [Beta vulgaris subsp. vulgaris]|nr:hypothetical protein BVRB_6g147850 [Beta vulgaris subsp. vulgaris]
MFKLTKDQVATLKLHATSQEAPSYKLSTFAIEAAHVWRTACRARGLADDQDVNLYISVNGRSRLKDVTLPQGYCGNIIFFALCKEKAGDVMSKPLWYSASKVHEAVKKMDDIEYLRSAIDFVELQPDITPLIRGPHTSNCPNLTIISWARLAFHDADFGWDRPHFTGINGIKYDGLTYITPSSNGDGSSSVGIKLFTPHMALFNEYFYDL